MTNVDVLLVAALPIELEAARLAGQRGYADNPGIAEWRTIGQETTLPYLLGDYEFADGSRQSIALARPTRMGGAATSPVVSSLVATLKPRCLAMCGVCAGNPTAVALGDVIVAEVAYVYDEGARTPHGFMPDHRQVPLAETWVRLAQDLSVEDLPSYGPTDTTKAKNWFLECLYAGVDPRQHPARSRYVPRHGWVRLVRELQDNNLIARAEKRVALTSDGYSYMEDFIYGNQSPTRLPFAVTVAPIASGSVVMRDQTAWDQLNQWGVRTVAGLEMEAATIAHTAHRLGVSDWVVAKGVMDHGNLQKDDRYRAFAAHASAEVLFKLLGTRSHARTAEVVAPTGRVARSKSVYVIGGVTDEYPDGPQFEKAELQNFCLRLGENIARASADLIVCSPFPDSADFQTLTGYLQSGSGQTVHLHTPRHPQVQENEEKLRSMLGHELAGRIKGWKYPGPENDEPESLAQAWLLCQVMALDQADVVISVGGRVSRTASTILHIAEARHKPVVPFGFLGGASERAYKRRDWSLTYPGLDHEKLMDKSAVVDAMDIADHMLTARIREHRGYKWPPNNIFVSRASANAEFGQKLTSYLTAAGYHVLFDEKKTASDRTIEAEIEGALLGADLFIALWSRHYAASPFCFDEIDLAIRRQQAGQLHLWLINLDGSPIVPPGARKLDQIVAPTPQALVNVVRDLLQPDVDEGF